MTLDELRRIAESVSERRGWDFSSVHAERDPVPWDYQDIVCRYLQPSSRVLDVGTGGGEHFLSLASHLHTGIGIDVDPTMIQVARENTPVSLAGNVSFQVMDAGQLQFPDAGFDLVLNRHTILYPKEIVRVLRPEGFFITQQVGPWNTRNICSLFGCGPGGEYKTTPSQGLGAVGKVLEQNGCAVVARGEYDVRYWFCDVESILFWLEAIPIPEDFDLELHWSLVAQILSDYRTAKGIETNEHREFLVAQKRRPGE
jgi:SAM-dependent methyltransferase